MGVEMRRMLSGKGFLAAFVLALAGIAAGTDWTMQKDLFAAGHFLTVYQGALGSTTVCYLLPLAAVLPWSDSFLGEQKGGFLKASLPRIGRRSYVESKIMTVALSGFLAWAAAGAAALFGIFVIFFPLEKQGTVSLAALWQSLQILTRLGLIAAILASLGGVCAALFGSGYLAFGVPFVGYYFCIILKERYFPNALWLYPPQWITGAAQWGENGEGLWMFLILFLALSVGIHGGVLSDRLDAASPRQAV